MILPGTCDGTTTIIRGPASYRQRSQVTYCCCMTTDTEWITRRQAAERSGAGMRTIDGWLASGKLAKYTDGLGRVRIDAAELDELLRPRPVVVSPNR